MVTLGGGEPTLHPQFWHYLKYAISELDRLSYENGHPFVGIVTNGSRTWTAIALANMAKHGKIWAKVSIDSYHDPIHWSVRRAFDSKWDKRRAPDPDKDYRQLGVEPVYIAREGRAKEWGNRPKNLPFCCGMHVHPNGVTWECSCYKHKLGRIQEGLNIPDDMWEYIEQGSCTLYRIKEQERERTLKTQPELDLVLGVSGVPVREESA